MASSSRPASAHTPHDVIADLAVSPDFASDRTVYTISRASVLKSTDGGDHWTRPVRGLDIDSAPSSLAVAPSDPSVVYLGSRGDGVYRSVDAGASWAAANEGLAELDIASVDVSPHDPDVVFARHDESGGLSRTRDGGRSWTAVTGVDRVTSLAFAPDDPTLVVAGDGAGDVHVSEDGGTSWDAAVTTGNSAVTALEVRARSGGRRVVHAGTALGEVHTSDTGGRTFTASAIVPEGQAVVGLLATTATGERDVLWASASADGAHRSTDGGRTWESAGTGLTTDDMADDLGRADFGPLAAAPGDDTIFLASFDGLFRTTDGGESWAYLDTQGPSSIAGIAVSPHYGDDAMVAVATYINGAFLSGDAGATWREINDGLADEYDWRRRPDYVARMTGIAFYPDAGPVRRMYGGVRGYFLEAAALDGPWSPTLPAGVVAEEEDRPDFYFPAFSPNFAEDSTIVLGTDRGKVFRYVGHAGSLTLVADLDVELTSLVASPGFADDRTLLAGTATGVYATHDAGATWMPAGDLPRYVTSLAVSTAFADDRQAWAGTPDGLFATDDGGDTWSVVRDTPFGTDGNIEAVVVSPAFASDGTMLVSARGLGLFRSTDAGRTFQAVAPQLLDDQVVFGSFYLPASEPIVFSPDFATDRTVYAISGEVLYSSTDAGDTWVAIELPVSMHDVEEDPALPFLVTPEPGTTIEDGVVQRHRDRRGFDTPVGTLTARRAALAVAMAGVVLFGLPVPARRLRVPKLTRWFVRAGVAGATLLALLAVLAA